MRRADQTPEQRAMFAERARLRDRAKQARRQAKKRAAKLAELKRPVSKTSPEYRRRFVPALMRQFCENLKRQIIVGPKLKLDMRRGAVVDRLIAAIAPHPDLGKPHLWSHGAKDDAVQALPWPLPRAADLADDVDEAPPADAGNVVSLRGGST